MSDYNIKACIGSGTLHYDDKDKIIADLKQQLAEADERMRQLEQNGCYTKDETGHVCGIAKELAEANKCIAELREYAKKRDKQLADAQAEKPDCHWKLQYDPFDGDNGVYDTGCGHAYQFTDGTPKNNGQKFCGYCGGKLIDDYQEHIDKDVNP